MSKKLFIGNLPWSVKEEDLRELFEGFGEIEEAIVMTDKFSGRSRGFGFVVFANDEDAEAAIEALNDQDFQGRNLIVNEARPLQPRPPRDAA